MDHENHTSLAALKPDPSLENPLVRCTNCSKMKELLEKLGEVMLQNDKRIMWLGVDIYEALLKFEQVREELNKVSSEMKKVSKELHLQGLVKKRDSSKKLIGDGDLEDSDGNCSNDA